MRGPFPFSALLLPSRFADGVPRFSAVDENRVKAINDRIQSINGERAKLKEEVVKLSSVQADLDAQKKQIEAERVRSSFLSFFLPVPKLIPLFDIVQNELKAEADGMQKQRQIWLRATTKYSAFLLVLSTPFPLILFPSPRRYEGHPRQAPQSSLGRIEA